MMHQTHPLTPPQLERTRSSYSPVAMGCKYLDLWLTQVQHFFFKAFWLFACAPGNLAAKLATGRTRQSQAGLKVNYLALKLKEEQHTQKSTLQGLHRDSHCWREVAGIRDDGENAEDTWWTGEEWARQEKEKKKQKHCGRMGEGRSARRGQADHHHDKQQEEAGALPAITLYWGTGPPTTATTITSMMPVIVRKRDI